MYKIYSCISNEETGIFLNLKNLQINNYGELVFIDKYLKNYSDNNYNNYILINVIPIDTISTNINEINKENDDYIKKIYEMIKNYNNLKIILCSSNTRVLNALHNNFINNKCGYYITDDLNYPDCEFYVLPEKKYNNKNIDLEIKRNHKVFITTNNYDQIRQEIQNDFDSCNNVYLIKTP